MKKKPVSYEELVKYLKEKDADYDEIHQPLYKFTNLVNMAYEIEITGDWKHSHGYTRYCLEQLGYTETKNVITEDDGSDWYGSVHTFVFMEK